MKNLKRVISGVLICSLLATSTNLNIFAKGKELINIIESASSDNNQNEELSLSDTNQKENKEPNITDTNQKENEEVNISDNKQKQNEGQNISDTNQKENEELNVYDNTQTPEQSISQLENFLTQKVVFDGKELKIDKEESVKDIYHLEEKQNNSPMIRAFSAFSAFPTSTIEREHVSLIIETDDLNVFDAGKLDWFMDTMNEAVKEIKNLTDLESPKIIIKLDRNLPSLATMGTELIYNRDYFLDLVRFDINNNRVSSHIDAISYSLVFNNEKFQQFMLPFSINQLYEYYAVEKNNVTIRGNGEWTTYTGSEYLNYYKKQYDESIAMGTFADTGLTYNLIKIKEEIGLKSFEDAFKQLVKFANNDAEPWKHTKLEKINLFFSYLQKSSEKNILDMFTKEELNVYENYFGGKFECLVTTESKLEFDTENFKKLNFTNNAFSVDKKLDKISGRYIGTNKLVQLSVKVTNNNLTLEQFDIEPNNEWSIKNPHLMLGLNTINIVAKDIHGNTVDESIMLINYSEENTSGLILDQNDDDNDGLKNFEEKIYGTDSSKPDTDSDGVSDYIEVMYTLTDPLVYDDNLNDDIDEDTISNDNELKYGTSPINPDTDFDGLSDAIEIQNGANPLNFDTDSDGLSDLAEQVLGTNPLVADNNETFNVISGYDQTDENNSTVKAHVEYESSKDEIIDKGIGLVKINESADEETLTDKIPGYLNKPVIVDSEIELVNTKLVFEYESSLKTYEEFLPTIYYLNSEKKMLEEIENQTSTGNKVIATIDKSGKYILIDKTKYDKVKNEMANKTKIKSVMTAQSKSVKNKNIIIAIDRSFNLRTTSGRAIANGINNKIGVDDNIMITTLNIGDFTKLTEFTKDKTLLADTIRGIAYYTYENPSSNKIFSILYSMLTVIKK